MSYQKEASEVTLLTAFKNKPLQTQHSVSSPYLRCLVFFRTSQVF